MLLALVLLLLLLPVSVAKRLTLKLRYSANGDDQQSLSFSYRIGRTMVSHIIQETLNAIWLAVRTVAPNRKVSFPVCGHVGFVTRT